LTDKYITELLPIVQEKIWNIVVEEAIRANNQEEKTMWETIREKAKSVDDDEMPF
jgi:hypothetical protein